MRSKCSARTAGFTESVIREMTRISQAEGGINLAQGFPDFPAPLAMKEAAKRAIDADLNQYATTWGAAPLREAIAARTRDYNGIPTDADLHVTVCCGATEGMLSALMAIVDPGDEIIIFQPFYENYGPDALLTGATPRFVTLNGPDWEFDPEELANAFNARTRAIIVNTPHNPTGKVFTRSELETIARLCIEHDVVAITDEIYEYILFDAARHVSLATIDGMGERTITISGLSKTWSATGWRIGWCIAPEEITNSIRKAHDFVTVGAPAPLQFAAAEALAFGQEYFDELADDYEQRRDTLLPVLESTGFRVTQPAGAYYVMTDISNLVQPGEDDVAFAQRLVAAGGVAAVPGSSFYANSEDGRTQLRFCFAKRLETLESAAELLRARLG